MTDGSVPVPHPGYPSTGEALIAYIAEKYPERLVATGDYDACEEHGIHA